MLDRRKAKRYPWAVALLLTGLTCLFFLDPAAAHDEKATPPAPGKLVDIGERQLHLHCTGSGSPAVIVENGSSSFSIDFALVQPEVAKFTQICTYDRAGHAWSGAGPARWTV